MKGNRGIKIALILISLGLFIPIVSFSFASGYKPRVGFLYNLQRMEIIVSEKAKPRFRPITEKKSKAAKRKTKSDAKIKGRDPVDLLERFQIEPPKSILVEVGNIIVEFGEDTPRSEIKRVCEMIFPEVGKYPARVRFIGWETEYRKIPYKYLFALGVGILFAGIVILVSSMEWSQR